MLTRKARLLVALTMLSVSFALMLPEASPLDKVRLGWVGKAEPTYMMAVLAAEEAGFWKQEGLEVEGMPFESGAAAHRAIAAGATDLGMGASLSAIQAIAAGVPEIIVADMGVDDPPIFWVRADSPIRQSKDIRGTRVAVTAFRGLTHALGVLIARSLDMEKEVKFVSAGGIANQIAALKSGAVDALILPTNAMASFKARGEAREVINGRDYLPKDWIWFTIHARKEFSEKNVSATKRGIKAFLVASEYLKKNPDWAIAKLKTHFGYPEEAARLVYGIVQYSRDGKIQAKAVENVVHFLVEFSMIPKERRPALNQVFSPAFTQ